MNFQIRRVAMFLFGVIVSFPLLHSGSTALARECFQYLPIAAVPVGDLGLCEATLNGETETFSCRKYRDEQRTYTVLFKGGRSPCAIYAEKHDNSQKQRRWVWKRQEVEGWPACDLERPAGVPAEARFMGTGVCIDDSGELTPCAMFEHEAARCSEIRRYLVFYDRDGAGPVRVTTKTAGINHKAMVAELAYQLGMDLLDAECCPERAEDYLAYAYQLFPEAEDYREGYYGIILQAVSN